MAISRTKRPTIVVVGTVTGVDPRTKRGSDEVFRHDITVETPTKGLLTVEVWNRDLEGMTLPDVFANVSIVAEVSESAQYGASLGFQRFATANDLDLIVSASGLANSKV